METYILDLPLEMKWEIIKYLNLKTALKYCIVLKLPREIAYRNHMLEIEIIDIWQWVNLIQVKTDSNPKYFEALLQNSNWKHYFGQEETFTLAAGAGLIQKVKQLLQDSKVDPSCFYNFPIILSSKNARLEVVQLLLDDKRVDPSDRFNSALRLACENGHLSIVNLLLQNEKVDPSDLNNSAIKAALSNKHLDIVNRLLQDSRIRLDGLQDLLEID